MPDTDEIAIEMVPLSSKGADGAVATYHLGDTKAPGPMIIFLHANGFNARLYRAILDPVKTVMPAIGIDLRGHGQTTLPADPRTFTDWSLHRDDVIATLDAMGKTGPFLFAGHSMGAATAMLITRQSPHLTAAILAYEPLLADATNENHKKNLERIHFPPDELNEAIINAARRRRRHFPDLQSVFQSYQGRGAFSGCPDDMLWDYIKGGTRQNEDGSVELTCDPAWEAANYYMLGANVLDLVGSLKCPLRIVYGTRDSSAPDWLVRELMRRFANVSGRCVDGCSHMMPLENTAVAAEELMNMARAVLKSHRA